MALAHRRGLLKPTYENGLISMVSEGHMLDSIELDTALDWKFKAMQVEYSFASLFNKKQVPKIIRQVRKQLDKFYHLAGGDLWYQGADAAGSVEDITKLYYMLAKAGIVTMPENPPEFEKYEEEQGEYSSEDARPEDRINIDF